MTLLLLPLLKVTSFYIYMYSVKKIAAKEGKDVGLWLQLAATCTLNFATMSQTGSKEVVFHNRNIRDDSCSG